MTRSEIILDCAEAALSPRVAEARAAELFRVAPNPFEQGRANEKTMFMRSWRDLSRSLIWC